MAQSGNVQNASAPPFATPDGKSTVKSGGDGGHDFVEDPMGSGDMSGGRDFTAESRSQSEAKPEVVPNTQEIPKGGKILKADPGKFGAGTGGTQGVSKVPFKGLR